MSGEINFIIWESVRNLIVGLVYIHSGRSDISNQDFTNLHLSPILQNLSLENKRYVLMGDFNVDLLKLNSHNHCNEFYNSMSSNFSHSVYFADNKVALQNID